LVQSSVNGAARNAGGDCLGGGPGEQAIAGAFEVGGHDVAYLHIIESLISQVPAVVPLATMQRAPAKHAGPFAVSQASPSPTLATQVPGVAPLAPVHVPALHNAG